LQFSSVCSLCTVRATQLNWHFSSVQLRRFVDAFDATDLRFQFTSVYFCRFVHFLTALAPATTVISARWRKRNLQRFVFLHRAHDTRAKNCRQYSRN